MKLDNKLVEEINKKREYRYSEMKEKSTKVSALNLKLNVAGIANVWLSLNYDLLNGNEILLFVALLLFVLSLFCDYIHYIISVILNHVYSKRILEVQDGELKISSLPDSIVNLTWFFWGIKILLTLSAYIILGSIVAMCLF